MVKNGKVCPRKMLTRRRMLRYGEQVSGEVLGRDREAIRVDGSMRVENQDVDPDLEESRCQRTFEVSTTT
jgi:hypothetical protein